MKINESRKEPFVGIKVRGIDHYFWFEKKDISKTDPFFIAERGWGKNRNITSIECQSSEIVSIIYSDNLQ